MYGALARMVVYINIYFQLSVTHFILHCKDQNSLAETPLNQPVKVQ